MKTSRPATMCALLSISLLAWPACSSSSGAGGQACVVGGSLLDPTYSCPSGLVCNTGESTPLCEVANAQSAGGPCGQDDNCQPGLFCNGKLCAALLTAGQSCPSGIGCAPGLVCEKTPAPVCVGADAAAPEAGQAGDATAPDGD